MYSLEISIPGMETESYLYFRGQESYLLAQIIYKTCAKVIQANITTESREEFLSKMLPGYPDPHVIAKEILDSGDYEMGLLGEGFSRELFTSVALYRDAIYAATWAVEALVQPPDEISKDTDKEEARRILKDLNMKLEVRND